MTSALHNHWILLPVIVQMALALETYLALAWLRMRAGRALSTEERRAARVDDAVWPDRVRAVNNNVRNQFELPVIFYALAIILWQLHAAGPLAQTLAWLFVASRVVHTFIHTGRNTVRWRFPVFVFGVVMVAAMAVLVLVAAFRGTVA